MEWNNAGSPADKPTPSPHGSRDTPGAPLSPPGAPPNPPGAQDMDTGPDDLDLDIPQYLSVNEEFSNLPFKHEDKYIGSKKEEMTFPYLVREIKYLKAMEDYRYFIMLYTMWHGELNWEGKKDFEMLPKDYKNMKLLSDIGGVGHNKLTFAKTEETAKTMVEEWLDYNPETDSYTLCNKSVKEAVSLVFGNSYAWLVIERCYLEFLFEHIRTRRCPKMPDDENLMIEISDHVPRMHDAMVKRMSEEILAGNVREIARCYVWLDIEFLAKFFEYIRTAEILKAVLTTPDKRSKPQCQDTLLFCSVAQRNPKLTLLTQILVDEKYDEIVGDTKFVAVQKLRTLMVACKLGQFDTYRLLLDLKVVPAPLPFHVLHTAVLGGNMEIVKELLQRQEWSGAQVAKCLVLSCTLGHYAFYQMLRETGMDVSGELLCRAVEGGNLDIVTDLLREGFDASFADPATGLTALHVAAQKDFGHIVQMLMERGADVNAIDDSGKTPAHMASATGCLDIVDMLHALGADLSAQDQDGASPLHMACRHGNLMVVERLLQIRSDLDLTCADHHGNTPLLRACIGGHEDVFNFLLDHGASVRDVNKFGNGGLHLCSVMGHTAFAKLLYERDPTLLDACNDQQWMPHHCACYGGHPTTVRFLMEQGVSFLLTTADGLSPLQLAVLGKQKHSRTQWDDNIREQVTFGTDSEFDEIIAKLSFFSGDQ
jgi:ankyrin repeat protein